MGKITVDRDRVQSKAEALEEKLAGANDSILAGKRRVAELTKKEQELQQEKEDLEQQIGVLTQERDVARRAEEELFDILDAKEEELQNTNDGYCHLTEQNHEMREDL